jgi:hypothetical protein
MRLFSVFDTYVDSYQIKDAVADLKMGIKGIRSVEVMERVAGEVPRYCVEYDIEDDGAQETIERIRQAGSQYSSYISNHVWGVYKKIG